MRVSSRTRPKIVEKIKKRAPNGPSIRMFGILIFYFFFTLIVITRSDCDLPRFFRNAPMKSMRISSRTRPKIVEKKRAPNGPSIRMFGKVFFTLIVITRSDCDLPRFFRNAPMKSMRISSRIRPKIVEKKRLLQSANRIPWKRTLPPICILRHKAITKNCDVETDVDVNCEEEVAENKVL